jgi:hypothetical protein
MPSRHPPFVFTKRLLSDPALARLAECVILPAGTAFSPLGSANALGAVVRLMAWISSHAPSGTFTLTPKDLTFHAGLHGVVHDETFVWALTQTGWISRSPDGRFVFMRGDYEERAKEREKKRAWKRAERFRKKREKEEREKRTFGNVVPLRLG